MQSKAPIFDKIFNVYFAKAAALDLTPGSGTEFLTYKDFRDAAPYVLGFGNTAENPMPGFYNF
jgi:hypothetical protein